MHEVTTKVSEPDYWWCTDHQAVEVGAGCRAEVRMGPYKTYGEAEHALDSAHERTTAWDDADRRWNDGD